MEEIWKSLEVHVQPFYNLRKQKIVGAEALIRSKIDENIRAADIIEMLKQKGKLVDFDIFMVEKLCQSISYLNKRKCWQNIDYPLNINLTSETLNEKGISRKIIAIIEHYDVKDSIVLELNEQSLYESKAVEENIISLTENGLVISLDDFNMTNQGLMALSKYGVGEVKFKQTGLGEFSQKDAIILKYLNGMCKELKINIVIEGIETKTQFETVKHSGIETIQGFIISKPVPFNTYTMGKVENN